MMNIKDIRALEEAYNVETVADLLAKIKGSIVKSTKLDDTAYYLDLYFDVKDYMESK